MHVEVLICWSCEFLCYYVNIYVTLCADMHLFTDRCTRWSQVVGFTEIEELSLFCPLRQ